VSLTAEETRARILAEAERLFRQFGYAKTTVAEIARCCGMSPANVYRFFASKAAINEAICAEQLAEGEALARRIARRDASPSGRLQAFIREIHELHRERFAKERKLHELVEVAMAEQWGAIDRYKANLRAVLVSIIADGIADGTYPLRAAETPGRIVFTALGKFFNPTMIAQNSHEDLDGQAAALAAFLDGALRAGVSGDTAAERAVIHADD
jgi:AcrR family transcriptional regulator